MTLHSKSILILSDRDYLNDKIDEAFSERGFSMYALPYDAFLDSQLPQTPPKAIIFKLEQNSQGVEKMIARIKDHYPNVNLPVLALFHAKPSTEIAGIDSVLFAPYHPFQIVLRVAGLIRLAEMEQEITLRLQTLQDDFYIQPEIPEPSTDSRFKILFIGKASPEFMVIINALQKEHVNVVAAFTSFTAFDFLYEQTFDTVVINGLKSTEPAFSIVETMRKNAKLYHVPALFLVNKSKFSEQEAAYRIGINDIIDTNASLEEISARVLEQANFHRMHESLKESFSALGGNVCVDANTNLYNRGFFNAHLSRVKQFYDKVNLPISLCLVRVRPKLNTVDQNTFAPAYKQIGSMIKNLVRMHDITARLNENTFAIAFPGQGIEELKPVAERITSILKCASISDQDTGERLDIDLEITFSKLNDDQNIQASA